MVTKAEIQSIDFTGNTCVVRMPYFENGNISERAIATATFANTPGSYNGYKENDVVIVGFEDNNLSNPVVLGKLYLGAVRENADPRGTINCTETNVSNKCTLPMTTKIVASGQSKSPEIANTSQTYKSLNEVVEKVVKTDSVASTSNGTELRIELTSSDKIKPTTLMTKVELGSEPDSNSETDLGSEPEITEETAIDKLSNDLLSAAVTQSDLTINIRDCNRNLLPGDIVEICTFRTWSPSKKSYSHHH